MAGQTTGLATVATGTDATVISCPVLTWDNQGVQYGLKALVNGQLSRRDFMDLNRKIGAWKNQHRMEPEVMAEFLNGIAGKENAII